MWTRAGAAGLLGCDIPAEHGGLGGDFGHECVVYEEVWRTGFSGFGKAVHEIAAHYVLDYASDEQKAQWLPRMVAGELVGAIAMSEPGAGSDLRGIATSAVRDGDEYVVNGSKTFITNGLLANLIMTVVRTDPAAGSKGYTLLMIETDGLEGFRRGGLLKKIGQKAQDTCELFFEDCRVPVSASLGEGQGLYQLMASLAYERTIVAVKSIAAIECAVRVTLEHTKAREAFGKRLFDLQNTRFKLAEAQTAATVGRVFADHCVQRVIDGHARRGDGGDGEVVADRAAVPRGRRLPAAARRLRLHARVPDRAPVRGRPRAAHLRGRERGDEGTDRRSL